jgi:crotonobetainyl-CoA:carnitine CoA-transferase CaiB-like acyl-CoA transferase
MPGPFTGLKIVDLTTVFVGPYSTQLLSDLGAEVIKVEAPDGDLTRMTGPNRNAGMAGSFLQLNRNKRSVVLDLKSDAGAKAMRDLLKDADVFVHNMRPEPLARLGFDYQNVKPINPSIVYCNIWGFGMKGPYAGRAAFDDIIQGVSGLVALEGYDGKEQRFVPMLIADKATGVFAALAMSAALYHKLATGEGQEIEAPMFECMTSFAMIEHLAGEGFVPPIGPPGSERHAKPMRFPIKTQDGYVCLLATSDRHWRGLTSAGGRPELAEDERYNTRPKRLARRQEVVDLTTEMALTRTSAEWVEMMAEAGVPCMQINTLDEVVTDPHLNAVNFWQEHEHLSEGKVRLMAPPYSMSETPPSIRRMPPRFGEHTAEVLAELGYDAETVKAMLEAGAAIAEAKDGAGA